MSPTPLLVVNENEVASSHIVWGKVESPESHETFHSESHVDVTFLPQSGDTLDGCSRDSLDKTKSIARGKEALLKAGGQQWAAALASDGFGGSLFAMAGPQAKVAGARGRVPVAAAREAPVPAPAPTPWWPAPTTASATPWPSSVISAIWPAPIAEPAAAAAAAEPAGDGGDEPELGKPLPSRGSEKHLTRTCHPCHYMFTRGGCQNGEACDFCHYKHTKRSRPRLPKPQRELCRSLSKLVADAYQGETPAVQGQAEWELLENMGSDSTLRAYAINVLRCLKSGAVLSGLGSPGFPSIDTLEDNVLMKEICRQLKVGPSPEADLSEDEQLAYISASAPTAPPKTLLSL